MTPEEAAELRPTIENRDHAPDDLSILLAGIQSATASLERAVAGYVHLAEAYHQHAHGLAPSERPRNLPLLSCKASADGVHVVDVVTDLRSVRPDLLGTVLAALSGVHAKDMYEAALSLEKAAGSILGLLGQVVQPTESLPASPPVEAAGQEGRDVPIRPGVTGVVPPGAKRHR
jgi:hypothetical protein